VHQVLTRGRGAFFFLFFLLSHLALHHYSCQRITMLGMTGKQQPMLG
jgi:hypothetical protein